MIYLATDALNEKGERCQDGEAVARVPLHGRCGSCRFAEPNEPHPGGEWLQCGLASTDYRLPDNPESLALAQDLEDCTAWLKVRPNYGCVQWQTRD